VTGKINVIDLFAGPGGLGEGFSGFKNKKQEYPFKIAMSVEKEPNAHKTLLLRSFFRQFRGDVPKEYYEYLKGSLEREALFEKFPAQSKAAYTETLGCPRELGNDTHDTFIDDSLKKIKRSRHPTVLIGGPPCQAYSIVGRVRNKGNKGYVAKEDNRHFLYKEYLRILHAVQPEVFVMENVKGILSSKVDGRLIFPDVKRDLEEPAKTLGSGKGKRYQIIPLAEEVTHDLFSDSIRDSDYIIKSENYGVPQTRHRVILLGIEDSYISKFTGAIAKNDKQSFTQDVLSDLPSIRSKLSPPSSDSKEAWFKTIYKASELVKKEFKKIGLDHSVLESFVERAESIHEKGEFFLKRNRTFPEDHPMRSWYEDDRLGGFNNHMSRGHKPEDLARYFFCSSYALQKDGMSPRASGFPESLTPNHKNWNAGIFVDRFKVQAKNRCASTITSHISKDGHYYIHHDPAQCRSLSVREAARLQTFPDNYIFEGLQTAQYVQVGNAVPPYLAAQIAKKVYEILSY